MGLDLTPPGNDEPSARMAWFGQASQIFRQFDASLERGEHRFVAMDRRLDGFEETIRTLVDEVKKVVAKIEHIDACVDETKDKVVAAFDKRAKDRKNGSWSKGTRIAIALYREFKLPVVALLAITGWWSAIHVFGVPKEVLIAALTKLFL